MATRKEYLMSLNRPLEEGESVTLLNKHRAEVGFFDDDYRFETRKPLGENHFSDLYAKADDEEREFLSQRMDKSDVAKLQSHAYIRNRYTGGQALSEEGYDSVIRELGGMDEGSEIDYAKFAQAQKEQMDLYGKYNEFTASDWALGALASFAKFGETGIETFFAEVVSAELENPRLGYDFSGQYGMMKGQTRYSDMFPKLSEEELNQISVMRQHITEFFFIR